jgi:hypothetical protein
MKDDKETKDKPVETSSKQLVDCLVHSMLCSDTNIMS